MGTDRLVAPSSLSSTFRGLDTTYIHRWHIKGFGATACRCSDDDLVKWVVTRHSRRLLDLTKRPATFRLAEEEKARDRSAASIPS